MVSCIVLTMYKLKINGCTGCEILMTFMASDKTSLAVSRSFKVFDCGIKGGLTKQRCVYNNTHNVLLQ